MTNVKGCGEGTYDADCEGTSPAVAAIHPAAKARVPSPTNPMVLDGSDPIEQHWPPNGPHTPNTVMDAAEALPSLVRYLNNATGPESAAVSLPTAPVVRRVTTQVNIAVNRIDELFHQLSDALLRHADDASLVDERGADYSAAPTAARDRLFELRRELGKVTPAVALLGHEYNDQQEVQQ